MSIIFFTLGLNNYEKEQVILRNTSIMSAYFEKGLVGLNNLLIEDTVASPSVLKLVLFNLSVYNPFDTRENRGNLVYFLV